MNSLEIKGLEGKWIAGDETLTLPIEVREENGSWIACYDGAVDVRYESLESLMREHTMVAYADPVHCECGEWSGEACEWSGPRSETVVVEFMPEGSLRESHTRAGCRGVFPHNGAVRVCVERACARRMLTLDGDWCREVGDAS